MQWLQRFNCTVTVFIRAPSAICLLRSSTNNQNTFCHTFSYKKWYSICLFLRATAHAHASIYLTTYGIFEVIMFELAPKINSIYLRANTYFSLFTCKLLYHDVYANYKHYNHFINKREEITWKNGNGINICDRDQGSKILKKIGLRDQNFQKDPGSMGPKYTILRACNSIA